jgi:hypothetical protein
VVHHEFRLGSGDEHVGVHLEIEAVEFLAPEQVSHGFSLKPPLRERFENGNGALWHEGERIHEHVQTWKVQDVGKRPGRRMRGESTPPASKRVFPRKR